MLLSQNLTILENIGVVQTLNFWLIRNSSKISTFDTTNVEANKSDVDQFCSDGKPEVCAERDWVVVGQVEQLHRHLLLLVLNLHRLFIGRIETAVNNIVC